MQISFENPEKVGGVLTLTVEEGDYKADVEKKLKEYRRRANMPGFRPGQVPMGLIRRQMGNSVKVDIINELLGKEMQKYITDNKLAVLGQPIAHEGDEPIDLEKDAPYVFRFDLAIEPEFELKLNKRDKVEYFDITVDDKLIDQQVEMFSRRFGKMDDKAESYDAEANDLLQGDLRQLDAEGNTVEGGLTLEAAKLMPSQIKVEAQRDLFKGAKLGDIITFNPRNAYPESDGEMAALLKVEKDQLADYTGDFSFQITQISHFVPAENNEELWKTVYGQDADIKDEAAFRQTIAEGVRQQLVQDEDFKFMQDVRKHCEKKVGELTFANDILKRVMLQNNQDKGEKFVEENYDRSIKELTWHLIKNKLVEQTGVKVEEQDIREIARQSTRAQFAQYGMGNIPDELIEKYADEMLKKRENVEPLVEAAIDRKLAVALKEVVKLDTKEISLEDFNKMLEA